MEVPIIGFNFNCLAKGILRHAVRLAGELDRLKVEHLFLSLLALDPSLIFWKLRHTGVSVRELITQVRGSVLPAGAEEIEPAAQEDVLAVLYLASGIASTGMPINSQHLFAAILLEGTNTVARYLMYKELHLAAYVQNRFPYLVNNTEVFIIVRNRLLGVTGTGTDSTVRQSLSHALREIMEPERVVQDPAGQREGQSRAGTLVGWHTESPEARAFQWLARLIPDQADRYMADGFVEVKSLLFPGRLYRIHRENRGTEVYEQGQKLAICCMHLVDSSFPPTDRVVGEYFLIRGDERKYLTTANISTV